MILKKNIEKINIVFFKNVLFYYSFKNERV